MTGIKPLLVQPLHTTRHPPPPHGAVVRKAEDKTCHHARKVEPVLHSHAKLSQGLAGYNEKVQITKVETCGEKPAAGCSHHLPQPPLLGLLLGAAGMGTQGNTFNNHAIKQTNSSI